MYRYYKITKEWADKLGETGKAPRHPDGMYLVLPNLGNRIAEILQHERGGMRLLAEEAYRAIGAIGLTIAEARASEAGELRQDTHPSLPENDNVNNENDDSSDNADNDENE